MTFSLENKTTIVTGAGSGIGRTIAIEFAKVGSDIVLVDRNANSLETVSKEIVSQNKKALPIVADVRDPDAVDKVVSRSIEVFKGIDILVNNAGAVLRSDPGDISLGAWDAIVDINLKGTFIFSKAVGKIMINQKSGSIINISSIHGRDGSGLMVHYAAAKAGVINLTKSLSMAWSKHNIRVNCIAPGYIWTRGAALLFKNDPDAHRSLPLQNSMNRWGRPEEIAWASIFLASDASSFITGQTLFIDGGRADLD